MTTQTEALKLALDALESCGSGHITDGGNQWYDEKLVDNSITAIKESLAQPEQEPVALRHSFDGYGYLYTDMGFGSGWIEWTKRSKKDAEPLYTTPPQRTWVDMTEAEANNIYKGASTFGEMMRMVEAKLKEKNYE